MPVAVFRCDATPSIGGGHLSRCLELAAALNKEGWLTSFAISHATSIAKFLPEGIRVQTLPSDPSAEPHALRTGWPTGVDLLVVDQYERGDIFARALAGWASCIVTFNDSGKQSDWPNVSVDMTPPAEMQSTLECVSGQLLLRGAWWTPLNPAFARLRQRLQARAEAAANDCVMISAGAIDAIDITSVALDALTQVNYSGSVDITLTSAAPHLEAVRERIQRAPFQANLHVDARTMAKLLLNAKIVIGAAGISSWERACLGKPSLAIIVADNQSRNAEALSRNNAAIVIDARQGLVVLPMVNAVASLLHDSTRRDCLSKNAIALNDGLGATRLVIALFPPYASNGLAVRLVPARAVDAELIFFWQTAPGARRFSRNPNPPVWQEHLAWFSGKLAKPDCIFNLVFVDDKPAGFVRLDGRDDNCFEVSILISQDYQRQGVASAALAAARRLVPDAKLMAEILPDNDASLRLFRQAGYIPDGNRLAHSPLQRAVS